MFEFRLFIVGIIFNIVRINIIFSVNYVILKKNYLLWKRLVDCLIIALAIEQFNKYDTT